MTRFWITLDQGVQFVLSCLEYMLGGEIFVPKIPSMKIVDLAKCMAPNVPHRFVGIRPGEKIHEVMITQDDARYTIELKDRYIIFPSTQIWSEKFNLNKTYKNNVINLKMDEGFQYSSNLNNQWLNSDSLLKFIREIKFILKNRKKYLHYGQQQIERDDIKAVINVLKSQFLTTGPEVEKFESKLKNFIGSKYALVCSNGSTALMLAFLGVGINKKSTVIMPSNNFAASANSAINLGAKVIFCDSSPESGLVEPDHLEKVLFKKKIQNGFFVGVHMNGQCMNMLEINKICKRYNLKIIDDAAHALGTKFKYRKKKIMIGSGYSHATTFSFHPVKTITMGEGGAITTNNKKIYETMKLFRNNGIERNSKNFVRAEMREKKSY